MPAPSPNLNPLIPPKLKKLSLTRQPIVCQACAAEPVGSAKGKPTGYRSHTVGKNRRRRFDTTAIV